MTILRACLGTTRQPCRVVRSFPGTVLDRTSKSSRSWLARLLFGVNYRARRQSWQLVQFEDDPPRSDNTLGRVHVEPLFVKNLGALQRLLAPDEFILFSRTNRRKHSSSREDAFGYQNSHGR